MTDRSSSNPLKKLERVKGTCRLKANSLKIRKIIFGQLCVLYSYFVAPTLALGQPTWHRKPHHATRGEAASD
jgi:hypothetical protein